MTKSLEYLLPSSDERKSPDRDTNIYDGVKAAVTTPALCIFELFKQAMQITQTLISTQKRADRLGWSLDPQFVCGRCSDLPGIIKTSGNSVQELPVGPFTVGMLEKTHCRICRFLGTTFSLYRHKTETYSLFSGGIYADDFPISGTYSLTPRFTSYNQYNGRLPILYMLPKNKEALKVALPKLYPRRVNCERIKSWIHECVSAPTRRCLSHQLCKPGLRDTLQPFKVIDCRHMCIVAAPVGCRFVALSYVWGPSIKIVPPDESGLLLDLPLTIRDSIKLALALGYLYIWIDRYCIDQTDAVDKHRQIQQMGAIYSSADLTIIVTCKGDLSDGLPGVSRLRKFTMDYESLGSMVLISHQTDAIVDIQMSLWATRAWTFQEGYFSRRRLYFTDNQVVFICNDQIRTEVTGEEKLRGVHLRHLGKALPPHRENIGSIGRLRIAQRLLEEFTQRNLSYESDALNAIAGALNTLNTGSFPVCHIWGVPFILYYPANASSTVSIALHWYHVSPVDRRPGFPSWSPLGWKGPAMFWNYEEPNIPWRFYSDGEFNTPSECTVQVPIDGVCRELSSLQTSVHSASDSSRCLHITAPMVQLSLFSIRAYPGPFVVFPWLDENKRNPERVDAYLEPRWDSEPPTQNSITCIFLQLTEAKSYWLDNMSLVGLLLINHGSHYERVGWLVYPTKMQLGQQRWASRMLTKGPLGILEWGWQSELTLGVQSSYTPTWLKETKTEKLLLR